ncbi:acyl-CoA dehydrogenase family protein [Cohnella hashimotonis]|uniref:Acyl-CoA dehydrogenase n=1 Tax=Cohnella hashimotonis TaxID=2826895 RepID=A0ABT6TPS8_9BACL|nr:acyl-CoA dehydrogenase family protein [Cohnella hashimotonis]MDI4648556.1 acyl-CoA dehydrogenase [Cohnella hashimotonis]
MARHGEWAGLVGEGQHEKRQAFKGNNESGWHAIMGEAGKGITESLLAQVGEVAAVIERDGRLPPEILERIYEERLFKLFVPDELGGRMTPLPEAARIFEQAAYADGSFGWLVTIGSGGGFFAATLPEETAGTLFADRRAVIAGSGHPTGVAKAVPGGYQVSGSWKYCSGAGYASFYTANCIVKRNGNAERPEDNDAGAATASDTGAGAGADTRAGAPQAPEIRSFAFLPEQVEIVRDWNAMGLRATESHTIRVADAFVPEARTFDIVSEPRYEDPIYRYPFLPFAQVSFAAVVLGLGRRFLDEAAALADAKRVEWDRAYAGRYGRASDAIAGRRRLLAAAADRFNGETESSWRTFADTRVLPDEEVRRVGDACVEVARSAVAAAHEIWPKLGMTALMQREAVNRVWRDLHTAAQHGVLNL